MLESIDINCDMGESFGNWNMGNDEGMMPRITTANVACGFHASDPVTMIKTVELAKAHAEFIHRGKIHGRILANGSVRTTTSLNPNSSKNFKRCITHFLILFIC